MIVMTRRLIAVAVAAMLIGNASAQEAKLKIATVDMMLLYNEYFKTNLARQELNVDKARIQKENNEKLTAIRQLESDIRLLKQQSEDPSLSDQKKAQVYQQYNTKFQEGIQLDKDRREYVGRKHQALQENTATRMRGILDEIRNLVEVRAKAENYDYVFDKSGMSTSQVPFLVYAKDATEITPLLLKELNKDAPAESLVPEKAPSDGELAPTPDVEPEVTPEAGGTGGGQ